MAASVVNSDEGAVGKAGERASFLAEAVDGDRVRALAKHLDGHLPPQYLVDGAEDVRCTTGAYGGSKSVATTEQKVDFR